MNDPRPETFYTDYLDAAKRHIVVCKELRKYLSPDYRLYDRLEKNREEILVEIYYLSGYIIECMLCFALGDFIDENTPDEDISRADLLRDFKVSVQGEVIKFKGHFSEDKHLCNKKIETLKSSRKTEGIPILDRSYKSAKYPHLQSNFEKLFQNWNPHWRYKLKEDIKPIVLYEMKSSRDSPYIMYHYIEFLVHFKNLIEQKFSYRTK